VTEAKWLGDGSRILTRDQAGTLRVWPVYDTPQALVDTARALVERAHPTGELTPQQREQFNLAP
jgi:hypothetical protein